MVNYVRLIELILEKLLFLQNEFLKLNSVLGDTKLLPQRKRLKIRTLYYKQLLNQSKPEQREMLLDALLEISDSDPFYDITWILRHMKLYFLS